MSTTSAISPALAAQTVTPTAASAGRLQQNEQISQNQFLTLFVAQLQNQDPLSPMEPNELTGQLAQFSSLEQLTGINSRLDSLLGQQDSGASVGDLLSMLGRAVDFDASRITVKNGQAASLPFTLSRDVNNAVATVHDADGNVVRRVPLGKLTAGEQTFAFDGKDDTGTPVEDGVYRVEITAVPVGGSVALSVPLITRATVDGVDLAGNPPVLLVGDRRLTIDQVRGVHLVDPNS